VNRRIVAGLIVLCGLVLACARPPTQDPNPQPDHGTKQSYKACPRDNQETVCVEFYAGVQTVLHIRVTGLNGKGEQAPVIDHRITVYPGGGAAGYELPLVNPPVAIGGRATGPVGIVIGCRVVAHGVEIPYAADENRTGVVACLYTTS
jgi:hypothetical protein